MNNLTLNELRSHFDRELMRKDSLESKASYILGIVAVILTLLFSILLEVLRKDSIINNKSIILFVLIITFIVVFVILILSLRILDVTTVNYPLPSLNPNELSKFFEKENLEDELKDKYLMVIPTINKENNNKAKKLSVCFYLIFSSSILVIMLFIGVLI